MNHRDYEGLAFNNKSFDNNFHNHRTRSHSDYYYANNNCLPKNNLNSSHYSVNEYKKYNILI